MKKNRAMFYTDKEFKTLYDEIEPLMEAYYFATHNTYALIAALEAHAARLRERQDQLMVKNYGADWYKKIGEI